MKTDLLNEINGIRYMFGYKPGKVISEQRTNNLILENEANLLNGACAEWAKTSQSDKDIFIEYSKGKTEGNPFSMDLVCTNQGDLDATNESPLSEWQQKLLTALVNGSYKN